MLVPFWGTPTWRPEIGKKHLEFTFARREVCFLLWAFENLDKYFSLYLHCLECWKSREESFWSTEQLWHSRPPEKLKLFCCQKNARYRAKELWRYIFLGNLSLDEGKISVGLLVLNIGNWWRHVKTKNWLNPHIKLKLIELAIKLYQEFWNCRNFHEL